MPLPGSMATESSKDVTRRLAEAHGRGDGPAIREILSPRLTWRMAGAPKAMGRDEYLEGFEEGKRAFSDMAVTIEDVVAEGEKVVQRVSIRVRHTGTFQGIEPTNRSLTFASVWFYRVVDARVVEAWSIDEDFVSKLR
jgi:predicted ester cyclase